MTYSYCYDSPLGRITLASNGDALTGLWFEGQKYFGSTLRGEVKEQYIPIFQETIEWLDAYFCGEQPRTVPRLAPSGSVFRKEVWNILLTIPYGRTMSYGEIAKILAEKKGLAQMSAQAVGGAVGHNPISILIPCHRVVGSVGSLTGYAGGVEKKKYLLTLEGADIGKLHVPKKGTAVKKAKTNSININIYYG